MPKGKRGSHGQGEPLDYQLKFVATDDRFPTHAAFERAVESARRLFLETGEELPGVHVIVRWRNPENENEIHRFWKTSDDEDQDLGGAYDTIIKKVR